MKKSSQCNDAQNQMKKNKNKEKEPKPNTGGGTVDHFTNEIPRSRNV
jgi:hypothetical protein